MSAGDTTMYISRKEMNGKLHSKQTEDSLMFFRLPNLPATFQTMMDTLFHNEIASEDIIIYMDDILIMITGSLSDHQKKVAQVLQ